MPRDSASYVWLGIMQYEGVKQDLALLEELDRAPRLRHMDDQRRQVQPCFSALFGLIVALMIHCCLPAFAHEVH